MKNIFISLVIGFSGISSHAEAGLIKPAYKVYASSTLSKENRSALNSSLKEWNRATNNWVKFSLTYVDFFEDQDNAIYIVQGVPKVKNAVATTSVLPFQRNSSMIVLSPDMKLSDSKQVVLHELGHAMKLNFDGSDHYSGDNKSIMFPYVEDSAGSIQCVDISSFCQTWGCKIKCVK